ncbi:tyrosine-type recombinase/integrase [Blastopirellula marina]|uniref:Integrase n=1 Tax=Blastopirellula marina DSM 3645 TaxID=314230 RepID=A3ZXD4_9BACT|nr:hypothetical protein DSM3645_29846 [Blastopirellula marina DSM 3645]
MASISKDPNGRRRVLFIAPDGKRKQIRLGKISQRDAESIKGRIEKLLNALTLKSGLDQETARWVADLDNATHEKLARVALVEPRVSQLQTLAGHIDAYLDRRAEVKPRTVISWKQARTSLLKFFGAKRKLASISVADAKDWERWLATPAARGNLKDLKSKQGLAVNTIRKRVANAKLFFEDAVARELIPANPFKTLKGAVGTNRERDHFVTRETIEKVLDSCPDAEWRLIVALSRFAGLRCPSEHLALTIDDVDWINERLRVPSPKTEHHVGKSYRVIPIFPELKSYLEDVCQLMEAGQKYLINRYRDSNANLRTQFLRILKKASVLPWEKLFQNMRASRATELADEYPEHVATAWMGHCVKVARQHYWQVTDDHFTKALRRPEKAAQNPAQSVHAATRDDSLKYDPRERKASEIRGKAKYGEAAQNKKVGQAGLEPATKGL